MELDLNPNLTSFKFIFTSFLGFYLALNVIESLTLAEKGAFCSNDNHASGPRKRTFRMTERGETVEKYRWLTGIVRDCNDTCVVPVRYLNCVKYCGFEMLTKPASGENESIL